MVQPWRLGEGSASAVYDPRWRAQWAAQAWYAHCGCDQRQHRHRLCHDRRGLGLPGDLGAAQQRQRRAKRILAALGAELIFTDPMEGTDGAIRAIRELVAERPERYFYPDQYNNPANVQSHYDTTGAEIWAQTSGRVTHFVAALGTCGTFVGAGRRLRAENPAIHLLAVQPDGPYHALEGVKHLPTTKLVPGIYDATLQEQAIEVSSEQAFEMARHLARAEGLMVGISAAANVAAALRVARQLDRGVVVTILCDGAAKYLSDRFWDEQGS